MNEQDIEIEETMTIPLASREQENAKAELLITVRIAWTPYEGIYAEPVTCRMVTYSKYKGVNGQYIPKFSPRHKIGDRLSLNFLDVICNRAVDENYSRKYLDNMLQDDPAFRGAWLYMQAENAADRGWAQSKQI